MLGDLRLALRRLLRQPTYTFVTVSILALGLGATTAMFSVMNEAMLRPLPYPRPDALVQLRVEVGPPEASVTLLPPFVFRHLREHNQMLEGIAAVAPSSRALGYPGQPPEAEVSLLKVSADFFPMLGMPAALGRVPSPDEDQEGRNQVVVLSDRLWRQQFGGDPAVLGKSLELGKNTVTVIGVMPPQFSDPMRRRTRADLWQPIGLTAVSMNPKNTEPLTVWARLKPGVSRKAAEAHLTGLLGNLGDGQARWAVMKSLGNDLALEEEIRFGILFTTGLSVFVLFIASVNLAGLQLARLAARGHEQAIRVALGAGRLRLMCETFAESLLLSVMGGALGLVLSNWCAALLASRLPLTNGPKAVGFSVRIDWRVWTFAGISVLVTALIVGTAPAWLRGREQLAQTLRKGARGTTDRGQPRLRRSLVVVQMAMALVLLMGGGLFVRGLERLAVANPGWQVDDLLVGEVTLKGDRYKEPAARVAYGENLQRQVAALPGVTGVALANSLPYKRPETVLSFKVEGLAATPRPLRSEIVGVSNDYFSALGIAVREGRGFGPQDVLNGLPVAVVNEVMARDLWPGASPIGKRVSFAWDRPEASAQFKAWRVVVGVVATVGHPGDVEDPRTPYQAYYPLRQFPGWGIHLAVRAKGSPEALIGAVRQAVAQVDPDRQLKRPVIARSIIEGELSNFRVFAWAIVVFAGLGLLLASLGVYGLFSGFVTEQTREIGVRMALGATRRQVEWLVLRKGMLLAGIGALAGIVVGIWVVVPVLGSVAFGLPPHEPLAVLLLALLLTGVAVFACWIPARRASRLDPLAAIRED
jgi:putative ABC transport system permease protein